MIKNEVKFSNRFVKMIFVYDTDKLINFINSRSEITNALERFFLKNILELHAKMKVNFR